MYEGQLTVVNPSLPREGCWTVSISRDYILREGQCP